MLNKKKKVFQKKNTEYLKNKYLRKLGIREICRQIRLLLRFIKKCLIWEKICNRQIMNLFRI